MKINRKIVVIALLAAMMVLAASLYFGGWVASGDSDQELTKDEALTLIKLQVDVDEAIRRRNEYAASLLRSRGLKPDAWNVDILNGRIVKAQEKTSDESN